MTRAVAASEPTCRAAPTTARSGDTNRNGSAHRTRPSGTVVRRNSAHWTRRDFAEAATSTCTIRGVGTCRRPYHHAAVVPAMAALGPA